MKPFSKEYRVYYVLKNIIEKKTLIEMISKVFHDHNDDDNDR